MALAAVGVFAGSPAVWPDEIPAAAPAPEPGAASPATPVEPVVEETLYATPTRFDRVGRVLAEVEVNDGPPLRFIVDTGANRSAISERAVTSLGLDPTLAPAIVVHGVTGTAAMQAVELESLRAGSVLMRKVRSPVLPDHVFAGADGILGVDGLQHARIDVDFENDRVRISRTTSRRPPAGYVTVPARLEKGGLLLVKGRIGRETVQIILDTGAERTLGNLPLRDLLLPKHRGDAAIETTVLGTTPDSVAGLTFQSPMVSMGSVDLRNLPVTFGDMHVFEIWGLTEEPALLVGMDMIGTLSRFIVDYGQREFQFKTESTGDLVLRRCVSVECATRVRRDN